uniref:Uncharacterized protein n=1 Tax=Ascaris lumbricoides TaxID=6252 RepID=A0A0M3I5Z9_ASCLU
MRKEANYGSVGSTAGVNNTNPEAVRTSLDRGQGLGWLRRSQQGCTETTPRERSELLSPAAGLVHSVCGATIYETEFPLAKLIGGTHEREWRNDAETAPILKMAPSSIRCNMPTEVRGHASEYDDHDYGRQDK